MGKKLILLGAVLLIVIISIAAWAFTIDINPLKEINKTEIDEITIHNPTKYFTITDQEDIQTLFEELQSMNISRNLNTKKVGFAFIIDIKLKNGETLEMSILSKDIRINNHNFKPKKDYCNRIQDIFNFLSKKYETNPA